MELSRRVKRMGWVDKVSGGEVDQRDDPRKKQEQNGETTYWMIKSTSLCLSIVSEWKLVIKNEIS